MLYCYAAAATVRLKPDVKNTIRATVAGNDGRRRAYRKRRFARPNFLISTNVRWKYVRSISDDPYYGRTPRPLGYRA